MRLVTPEQYKESVFQGCHLCSFCFRVGLVKNDQLLVKNPCVDLNMKDDIKRENSPSAV